MSEPLSNNPLVCTMQVALALCALAGPVIWLVRKKKPAAWEKFKAKRPGWALLMTVTMWVGVGFWMAVAACCCCVLAGVAVASVGKVVKKVLE